MMITVLPTVTTITSENNKQRFLFTQYYENV